MKAATASDLLSDAGMPATRTKKVPTTSTADPAPDTSVTLVDSLLELRQQVEKEGRARFDRWRPKLKGLAFRPGALNMAHYLALRKRAMRPVQQALTPWGLSSLGRSEGRVLANLDAVPISLAGLTGRTDLRLP